MALNDHDAGVVTCQRWSLSLGNGFRGDSEPLLNITPCHNRFVPPLDFVVGEVVGFTASVNQCASHNEQSIPQQMVRVNRFTGKQALKVN